MRPSEAKGKDVSESDTKSTTGQPDKPGPTEIPIQTASSGEDPADPPAAPNATPADGLREKLEQAQAESLKMRDQLLRTAADFDNFRKRTRKDIEDAGRKGLEKALLEVLPVSDNLERAVAAAQQAGDLKSVVEGVTMVLNFLGDALSRLGVERVESVGKPFDPSLHEAVQQVESDENAGQVVSELTPGYKLGDKLLRAAMVVVARPRPSSPPPSPDNDAPES